MSELVTFHVVSVKLLIEQRGEDEGRAVSEQAQVAVDAACTLLQHVTGRETRNRALVLEPIRLIEPASQGANDDRN